jgi:predicted RNA-binding Zn ribbon-like protein
MPQDLRPLWIPLVPTPYGRNALCLEWTNTVSRGSDAPSDSWLTYADLLDWSRDVGAVTAEAHSRLSDLAQRRPDEAAIALERARVWREAVFGVASSLAAGKEARDDDREVLAAATALALGKVKVAPTFKGPVWGWNEETLETPVWPCLVSAAELLTSPLLGRVRECASDTCGWLFLDLSPNRSRRWCDMQSCGNRAKAKRFHSRHKSHV